MCQHVRTVVHDKIDITTYDVHDVQERNLVALVSANGTNSALIHHGLRVDVDAEDLSSRKELLPHAQTGPDGEPVRRVTIVANSYLQNLLRGLSTTPEQ